jgi:choline monooxygenase
MSDLRLSPSAILDLTRTQLPVASYFDEATWQREQDLLIRSGPRYVGHALSVPAAGDHHTLLHEGEGRVLVRGAGGAVELISNVCRHRQALTLRGRGNTGTAIVCPLHRWTYDLEGRLIGAPHFDEDPCLHLKRYPLQQWNGLLFEGGPGAPDVAAEMAGLKLHAELDFSGYVFDRVHLHECDYNWKTFIEVYLEDYHVGPFHPGLGNFVTTDDLRWQMAPDYSVQSVGVASSGGQALGKPGSAVYKQWHDALLNYRGGEPPKHGAIWLTHYPLVMVEYYPHVLVVSSLHPRGPRKTLNVVEFFYPEEIHAFEREFVEAQQAAYMETCIEDDEIALRMDAGRLALLQRGDDEAGPYQSPMEDGMEHFHRWYRRRMAA